MQRWHLTLGLSAIALAAAAFAPRLFTSGAPGVPVAAVPPPPPTVDVVVPPGAGHLILDAALDRGAVLAGQTNDRFVVISLTAPKDLGKAEHRPVDLGVVMDVSGSMTARGKIDYAKKAAKYLMYQMSEGDSYSLTTFSDDADVVISAGPVTDAAALAARIDRIHEGGGTNIGQGLEEGSDELRRVLRSENGGRIVLLTDGNPTVGIKDPDALARVTEKLRAQGFTVSVIGLGLDYNEDLLQRLADTGGGSYNFVDDPAEIQAVFDDELARSVSVVAANVNVHVDLPAGVELLDVVGWPSTRDASGFTVDAGEIVAGQTRKIVARVRVTPGVNDGTMPIASVQATYTDVIDAAPGFASTSASAQVTADRVTVANSLAPTAAKPAAMAWGNTFRQKAARSYASGNIVEAQEIAAAGEAYFDDNARMLNDGELTAQGDAIGADLRAMPTAAPSSAEGQRMVKQAKEDAVTFSR